MQDKLEPVFVWRNEVTDEKIWEENGENHARYIDSSTSTLSRTPCVYCGGPVIDVQESGEIHESNATISTCELCGWRWAHETTYFYEITSEHILRQFDINSAELSLNELGSYLRSHYDDVNGVSGRTFERLIGDIFLNQGFHVELTKSSRDGGFDIFLLGGNDGPIIVEVKRMRKPVGVSIVRQLRGVQVREGIGKAMLVTSGQFSGPARNEAKALHPIQLGYGIELLDADDILRLLDTYRTTAFSLQDLDKMRKAAWSVYKKG